jgi:ribosomal protein S18 acetylase RimI-like enzyme
MEIHIRRGRRADFEALSALCAWPMVEQSPARSTRLFRNTVSDLAYDLYVADDGGTPVGMVAVSYVRVLSLGGHRATLEELVVRPDRRRAGLGRRLLEFAIGRARRRGARTFEARPNDDAAERFLDHVGFRPGAPRYSLSLAEDSP